jgi:CDGSH-type Zn-finger protein
MLFGDEVVIVPYRDGPYVVRGAVSLRDQHGNEIALSREPIALCRCGKSRVRPFCDGTHRITRFAAPSEMEAPATSGVQTSYAVQTTNLFQTADGVQPTNGLPATSGLPRTVPPPSRIRSLQPAADCDAKDDVLRSAHAQMIRAALLRAAKLVDLALCDMGADGSFADAAPDTLRAATALREVARRLEALR